MSETGNQASAPASAHGLVLAAARRAQGLEIADVARQLKLSAGQIEALESGNFDRLPGPVFVRGFVRNYARLLKLDPDEVWGAMESAIPANNPREELPPSQDIPFPSSQPRRSWPRYAVAVLLLFAALSAYEFYPSDGVTVQRLPVQAVAVPAAAPAPATADVTLVQAAPSAPADVGVAVPAEVAATPPDAERRVNVAGADAVGAVPPAKSAASGSPSRPAAADEHKLRLVFDKESWVEIRDRSGRAILSRTNKPGTEQRISGLPPFSLVIGNAHGVKLIHNDNPVDLAQHTRVDVARFTIK